MDFKRDYQRLLARAVAGEKEEEQGHGDVAALGRWLAENEVSADEIARLHAAAVDQHLSAQAPEQRTTALLRSSRVLAELMLWRGIAECLLRQKHSAESELRDLGHVIPPPSADVEVSDQPPVSFRHPLAEVSAFLARVAVTDSLTGVYNARYFHTAIEAQIKGARDCGSLLSLLMVDMDGLSRYNQVYGWRQGDEVLTRAARLLMENTRSSDFVARCGGDEFAIILPDCTTRRALALAERLRRVLEEHGLPGVPTASFGVATFPADASSDRALINVTQQACHLAQRLGGNTVCTALVAEADAASAPGPAQASCEDAPGRVTEEVGGDSVESNPRE